MSVEDKILNAIKELMRAKTGGYDTAAKVVRIDGNTAYVHIDGGVPETPVSKTIDCKVGDTVRVRLQGGGAHITGNDTAPPTDDAEALISKAIAKVADKNATKAKTTAEEAQQTANAVSGIANLAYTEAQEAKQIADDTEQHFWFAGTGTDTGAHITEVPRAKFTDPTDPDYQSGGNLLARSNGIAVREGMKELATMSQDGFDAKTYDDIGNELVIAHLGYGEGTDSGGSLNKAPYYDIGHRLSGSTKGNYSVAEGANTTSSGYGSHAEGLLTKATSTCAHAEGDNVTASGIDSHAEGTATLASGRQAHAEGDYTEATGDWGAHAEGYYTKAVGRYSHSQNYRTEAGYDYQTVIGKYNNNKSANLFEVGNGTADNARSNAFEVTLTGDATADGDISDGNGDSIASVKDIANTAATNLATLGTIKDSGEKDCGSIASSTSWNRLGGNVKVALTAGTWILIGWVNFATKADTTYAGTRRAIRLYKVTATAGAVADSNVIVGPSDANTNIQVVYPVHITSGTTYRVEALQNAPGSTALATKARLFAVKVGL